MNRVLKMSVLSLSLAGLITVAPLTTSADEKVIVIHKPMKDSSVRATQASTTKRAQVPMSRGEAWLSEQIRHRLVMLVDYSVFDNLAYRINGSTVELYGQVVKPTLRSAAEKEVKGIEGVERVDNRIEVLPLSTFDDRLRVQLYRTIFSDSTLSRYSLQPVPPIHIIVKNGHVTLEGVVSSEGERNLAGLRANSVPSVFSVENNLRVEG